MRAASVSPVALDARGGTVLRVRGEFDPTLAVRVVLAVGGAEVQAYAGQAGQGARALPTYTEVRVVSPALPPGVQAPTSAVLRVEAFDDAAVRSTAPTALRVVRPGYGSHVYALRGLHPPLDATGPRDLAAERARSPMLPGALLEPLLDALGETFTSFGGTRSTWVTTPAAGGQAALQVHGTLGLSAGSRVLVGAQVYDVASVGPSLLSGLRAVGAATDGLLSDVREGDEVIDVTPGQSQVGRLHESYFLDGARGADLSTCGRNLGLARDPSIRSDATYAAACRAIAYGPRGTMRGLRTALDAMVGPGNYTLDQDTLAHPCRVFVGLPLSLTLASSSMGRTYPSGPRARPAQDSGTLRLPAPVHGLERVARAAVDQTEACDGTRPGPPWVYAGGSELTGVSTVAGLPGAGGFRLEPSAGAYACPVAEEDWGRVSASLTVRLETPGASALGSTGVVWGVESHGVAALCRLDGDAFGRLVLRPCDASGNALSGTPIVVRGTDYAEVCWRRETGGAWTLRAGGRTRTLSASRLPASSQGRAILRRARAADPGVSAALLGCLRLHLDEARNRAEARGTASVDDAAPQVVTLDVAYPDIRPGHTLRVSGSQLAVRAPGRTSGPAGSQDGAYVIQAVSGAVLTVRRFQRQDAVLGSQAGHPDQVDLPDAALSYPEDIGKRLVVGGTSGNAGAYRIADLVDAQGTVCTLPYPRACASCRVVREDGSAAQLTAQSATPVEVGPAFVDEVGLSYVLPQGYRLEEDGPDVLVHLAQPLADVAGSYDVTWDDHLGSVVVDEEEPVVVQTGEDPVRFSVAPIYAEDSLAYVGNYITQICAAGVRAVVNVS